LKVHGGINPTRLRFEVIKSGQSLQKRAVAAAQIDDHARIAFRDPILQQRYQGCDLRIGVSSRDILDNFWLQIRRRISSYFGAI